MQAGTVAHCTFIGIINLRAAPVTHELNGQFDNTDILEYFVSIDGQITGKWTLIGFHAK